MGDNRAKRIVFNCEYCKAISSDRPSHYKLKKRHFCSMSCYAKFRKEKMPPEQQNSWRGGVSATEAHKRWKAKNPGRMAHLKARRYAREKRAEGSHSFIEWEELKAKHNNLCAACKQEKPLTKDHIIPLSKGGSDNINNIQPLCRNCNSKKWAKIDFNIYQNPELLK